MRIGPWSHKKCRSQAAILLFFLATKFNDSLPASGKIPMLKFSENVKTVYRLSCSYFHVQKRRLGLFVS